MVREIRMPARKGESHPVSVFPVYASEKGTSVRGGRPRWLEGELRLKYIVVFRSGKKGWS